MLDSLLKTLKPEKPTAVTEILLLGSTHFNQNNAAASPNTDLLSAYRSKEVTELVGKLAAFKPDLVLVEESPADQQKVDSLYSLYASGKLKLAEIQNSRAERYQFGFQTAKAVNHKTVYGVDHYELVSSRMLKEGTNLDYFISRLDSFSNIGAVVSSKFALGKLSVKDFLIFLNDPKLLDITYQAMFVNPARVMDGKFTDPPKEYINTASVDNHYIGAEYISAFYERELKIYSNIVRLQLQQPGKRMLLIMGQRHAAVLTKILANDPSFKIIPVAKVLK